MPLTPDAGAALVIEAQLKGGANAIYHVLDEGDVRRIMRHPQTMIASDGRLSTPGDGHPHPRAYGTFPRVLGHYVRAGVLSLEPGIHKMTGMPATRLGLADRGILRVGAMADVVVFDPRTTSDRPACEPPPQSAPAQSPLTVYRAGPAGGGPASVGGGVARRAGRPAGRRGLADGGIRRVGAMADVVVFEPRTISDRSTFEAPHQYATGIDYVLVNGVVAVDGGTFTDSRAGRVLRHLPKAK